MISHKAAWKAAGRRRRSWPSPATGAEHCALDTPARSCADRDPGATREAWLEPLVLGNTKFLMQRAFMSPGSFHPPKASCILLPSLPPGEEKNWRTFHPKHPSMSARQLLVFILCCICITFLELYDVYSFLITIVKKILKNLNLRNHCEICT